MILDNAANIQRGMEKKLKKAHWRLSK